MKLLKNTLLLGSLMFAFSCGHMGHKACCSKSMSKSCVEGQCKKDKSCCDNKCTKCTGEKDSCKKAQCDISKKKKS